MWISPKLFLDHLLFSLVLRRHCCCIVTMVSVIGRFISESILPSKRACILSISGLYRQCWTQLEYSHDNCGWQEKPAILISSLLLHFHGSYVASFQEEWIKCTECSLITRVWIIYPVKLMQSTPQCWSKSVLTFDRCLQTLRNLWLLLVQDMSWLDFLYSHSVWTTAEPDTPECNASVTQHINGQRDMVTAS